jgi:hypothetical protein
LKNKTLIVDVLDALAVVVEHLRTRNRSFAVTGAFAIATRCKGYEASSLEVVAPVESDEIFEALVDELSDSGWESMDLVEHTSTRRLASARLVSGSNVELTLVAARSGLESEIVERAEDLTISGVGTIPIARAEELLAMKLVTMLSDHLEDLRDALTLLTKVSSLDLDSVRENLRLASERQYNRGRDLEAQLDGLLRTSQVPNAPQS